MTASAAIDPAGSDGGPGAHGDHDDAPSEAAGRVAAVAFSALLFFPVKDLLESHVSAIRLWLVLTGVAAFFVVFVWRLVFTAMTPRPSRSTWVWLVVASGLASALTVGDDPRRWAPLFIFVSAVVGVRVALPWAAYGIAACTLVSAVALVPTAPLDNALAIVLQTLAVGALTVGMGRLRATITELQEAREQLARLAVTEERLRFARDIHDLLGHSLSVVALKAELAGRLLPAQVDLAAKEVAEIDAVARHALAEVRDAVSGYRQPSLAEALSAGRLALDAAGIDASWDVAQVVLPPDVEALLAWASREAITNIVRHSRARRCWVRVTAGLVETAVEVTDDGVGHPGDASGGPGTAPLDARGLPPWAGHGLCGLAERVAALHGQLEISARPEGGFRVKVSVPTAASLAGVPR